MEIFSAALPAQAVERLYDGSMSETTAASLAAAYDFQGNTATVTDVSGNGKNGTISGNAVGATGLQTVNFTTSSLPVDTAGETIAAVYSGDANYAETSVSLVVAVDADVVAPPTIDTSLVTGTLTTGTPITLSVASPDYADTYAWSATSKVGGQPTTYDATGTGTVFSFTPDIPADLFGDGDGQGRGRKDERGLQPVFDQRRHRHDPERVDRGHGVGRSEWRDHRPGMHAAGAFGLDGRPRLVV